MSTTVTHGILRVRRPLFWLEIRIKEMGRVVVRAMQKSVYEALGEGVISTYLRNMEVWNGRECGWPPPNTDSELYTDGLNGPPRSIAIDRPRSIDMGGGGWIGRVMVG